MTTQSSLRPAVNLEVSRRMNWNAPLSLWIKMKRKWPKDFKPISNLDNFISIFINIGQMIFQWRIMRALSDFPYHRAILALSLPVTWFDWENKSTNGSMIHATSWSICWSRMPTRTPHSPRTNLYFYIPCCIFFLNTFFNDYDSIFLCVLNWK